MESRSGETFFLDGQVAALEMYEHILSSQVPEPMKDIIIIIKNCIVVV